MVDTILDLNRKNSERPLGVAVIAVVVIVFGIVAAIVGLLGMLAGFAIGIMGFPGGAGLTFLAGLAGLVLGAIYVIAGIGLWDLRPWAWWVAVLAGVVGFLLALGSPIWMVMWALLVGYLFVVRAHFGTLPNVPRLVKA